MNRCTICNNEKVDATFYIDGKQKIQLCTDHSLQYVLLKNFGLYICNPSDPISTRMFSDRVILAFMMNQWRTSNND